MTAATSATRTCAIRKNDPHEDAAAHAAGCLLCWLSLYSPDPKVRAKLGGDPDKRQAAPVPKPIPAGLVRDPRFSRPATSPQVSVRHCARRDVWEWAVFARGQKVDYGYDQHEEEARRAAAKAADRHRPAYRWVSTADLATAAVNLAGKLPLGVTGVAGIPRSGIIPASVIAAILHVPLYQLTEEGKLERLGHGSRGRASKFGDSNGTIAVVDDTVYGGGAMYRARQAMRGRSAVLAAAYVRPDVAHAVDVYGELLPSPHILEWNWTNNGTFAGNAADPAYGAGIACDLDGILVHDSESGGQLGGPLYVPRLAPCPAIITGRAESTRAATEAQLAAIGAKYDRLIMVPGDKTPDWREVAKHKAEHYARTGCGFFAESSPSQAEEIARLSGRPVICPRAGKVF
jgi:adenine/guanine phosphoribosyltransferase-like PRPP-binding protein